MVSPSRFLVLLISFVLIFVSSCTGVNPASSEPIITVLPTILSQSVPAVTISPTTLPTSVPTSTVPPTPKQLICSSYHDPDFPDEYSDLSSFLNVITTNLNSCASLAAVMDSLRFFDKYGFVFTIDLNQDHVEEIIMGGTLYLLPPQGQTWTEHADNLVVFYQKNGKYEAKVMFEGSFNGSPEISNIIDVNGDGVNEAIFTIPYGGSGCNEGISIIGWYGKEPLDYFRDLRYPELMDCPATTEMVDINNDGIMEVVQKHRGSHSASNSHMPDEMLFQFSTKYNAYVLVP